MAFTAKTAVSYVTAHPIQSVLHAGTAVLLWNQWNQMTNEEALEMREIRKRFIETRNQKLGNVEDDQAPSKVPSSHEMETVALKKNIRNGLVISQVLTGLVFLTLGICAVCGLTLSDFSIPFIFTLGGGLLFNAYITKKFADHFKMHEYTHKPKNKNLEKYANKKLNKPKYQSNGYNTLLFVASSLLPGLNLLIGLNIFWNWMERNADKMIEEDQNN